MRLVRKSPTLAEEPGGPIFRWFGGKFDRIRIRQGTRGTSVTFGIAFDPPRICVRPLLSYDATPAGGSW